VSLNDPRSRSKEALPIGKVPRAHATALQVTSLTEVSQFL